LRWAWKNQFALYVVLLCEFIVIFLARSSLSPIQTATLGFSIVPITIAAFGSKHLPSLWSKKFKWNTLSIIVVAMSLFGIGVHSVISPLIKLQLIALADISLLKFRVPYLVFFMGFLPAISEELLFRGLLYSKINVAFKDKQTIVITTVLFYLAHLIFPTHLLSFMWLVPLGIILGFIRSKSDSVIPSITGHFSYNITVVLLSLYY
jgi:membrane protease YdiL (CAAX protease family)